jgi:hypothetical protein
MPDITVGEFTYNAAENGITGPAEYLDQQGAALVEQILDGNHAGFNACVQAGQFSSADPIRGLLAYLQIDYAGWKGARQLLEV